MQRFTDELLPRDRLTKAILAQMEKDGTDHVWEDLRTIPDDELRSHFPNIASHCMEMGYDVTKECIPVVPAQHYFMGGIKVDYDSRTTMNKLYAVGETACNRVHGRNRLASNSLLESMVFAGKAAENMTAACKNGGSYTNAQLHNAAQAAVAAVNLSDYDNYEALAEEYRKIVLGEIDKANAANPF